MMNREFGYSEKKSQLFWRISEGLQEMLWNTAVAYISGFEGMSDSDQGDVLDNLVERMLDEATILGYTLNAVDCTIKECEDEWALAFALQEIEVYLDNALA